MAQINLTQRGVATITSSDGAGPKNVTLPTAIKLASSAVHATVRDRRQNVSVQRGTVLVSSGGASPQDVTITAVDLAAAHVNISVRENRDGNARGVTAKLTSSTNLRLQFYGTVDASENIEIEWEVIEHKPRRGAYVRLTTTTNLEISWDGTLVAGETIEVAWEVFDIENFVDEVKETNFRLQRALGYLGENILQDKIVYDDAGNPTNYRLRVFDTKANADAATVDTSGGLQTGELARVDAVQSISVAKNRRKSLLRGRTDVISTPGVD